MLAKSVAVSPAIGYVCLAVVIATAGGCGEARLPTYPVSGQVVYADGAALKYGGSVRFVCSEVTPPITAKGRFGADGRFVLTTFDEGDGAIAGEHKVFLIPNVADDREEGMSPADYAAALHPVDKRFTNSEASGLKFTVAAETAPHEFRVEVTRPRRRR